jgi:hypothetical protein
VTLGGPPGSGRSRALRELARRLPHHWLQPGRQAFESLGSLAADVDLDGVGSGADARARVLRHLATTLDENTVLIADGVEIDYSTRRLLAGHCGAAVTVGDPDETLPELTEADLRALFHGPDRVLHLREDGAAELFRRAGARPASIVAELTAWRRLGLVRKDGDRYRITRATLDRLRAEEPPRARALGPGEDAAVVLPPSLDDLAAWLEVVGGHATTGLLVAVTGRSA